MVGMVKKREEIEVIPEFRNYIKSRERSQVRFVVKTWKEQIEYLVNCLDEVENRNEKMFKRKSSSGLINRL